MCTINTMRKGDYRYEYARPALTVDCVVFGADAGELRVLLIERGIAPFEGDWALPGGFVGIEEELEAAALRELHEETGVEEVFLEQFKTYGAIHRDPRERIVTVAYYALVKLCDHRVQAATDARDAAWFGVAELPKLAFDHQRILNDALVQLRVQLRRRPIGFKLLPRKFALSELQALYEAVLERPLDKRNFRKKVLSMDLLVETDEVQKDVQHRAARLYRFDEQKYHRLVKAGFDFEL